MADRKIENKLQSATDCMCKAHTHCNESKMIYSNIEKSLLNIKSKLNIIIGDVSGTR